MTVYISADAKNLREELASLRNQGGYEERQFYFDSLVTNGTFDSSTVGWTNISTGTGTAVFNSGTALLTSADSSNRGILTQAITTVVGVTYVCSIEVTQDSGVTLPRVGTSQNGLDIAVFDDLGVGVHTLTFIATTTTTYITLNVSSGNINFDNISVYEVDANDDVVHRMPKGWVPLHVYEDGLLQREGAAHDYEVVYDGFDYYVKPAVAPGATTETCVIGVRK